MGCFRNLVILIVALVVSAILLIAFLPDTRNSFGFDVKIHNYKLDLPESFSGSLLANKLLSKTNHLYVNEIQGPESFAIWQGRVFTSLADGRIVEVLKENLKTIVFLDPNKVGLENCRKPWFVASGSCSRPLGLRFDSKGKLYAVDPYHGIFRIDIATGQYEQIMDIQKHRLPDGTVANFLDDIVLIERDNGHLTFYLSLASTKWLLHDVFYTFLEYDQSGQLLSFDTETKKLKVEAKDLAFPNGLELTDDKSSVLVNELNSRTIYKFNLKGASKGKLTVWSKNLPGEPDNIKRSADPNRETYLVALFSGHNKQFPALHDRLTNFAYVRRFFCRLQRVIGRVIEFIGQQTKCDCLKSLGFDIKSGNIVNEIAAKHYGLVLEIDNNGQIINSLHDPSGVSSGFSEIHEIEQTEDTRVFLLGSFQSRYLGRLVVKKQHLNNFSDDRNTRKVVVEEKKTTTVTGKNIPQKTSTTSTTTATTSKSETTNNKMKTKHEL